MEVEEASGDRGRVPVGPGRGARAGDTGHRAGVHLHLPTEGGYGRQDGAGRQDGRTLRPGATGEGLEDSGRGGGARGEPGGGARSGPRARHPEEDGGGGGVEAPRCALRGPRAPGQGRQHGRLTRSRLGRIDAGGRAPRHRRTRHRREDLDRARAGTGGLGVGGRGDGRRGEHPSRVGHGERPRVVRRVTIGTDQGARGGGRAGGTVQQGVRPGPGIGRHGSPGCGPGAPGQGQHEGRVIASGIGVGADGHTGLGSAARHPREVGRGGRAGIGRHRGTCRGPRTGLIDQEQALVVAAGIDVVPDGGADARAAARRGHEFGNGIRLGIDGQHRLGRGPGAGRQRGHEGLGVAARVLVGTPGHARADGPTRQGDRGHGGRRIGVGRQRQHRGGPGAPGLDVGESHDAATCLVIAHGDAVARRRAVGRREEAHGTGVGIGRDQRGSGRPGRGGAGGSGGRGDRGRPECEQAEHHDGDGSGPCGRPPPAGTTPNGVRVRRAHWGTSVARAIRRRLRRCPDYATDPDARPAIRRAGVPVRPRTARCGRTPRRRPAARRGCGRAGPR